MGLDDRTEIYLREVRGVMQERQRRAEVDRIVREARLAQPAPWRSALASGLRAAAERLEPRPTAKEHTL